MADGEERRPDERLQDDVTERLAAELRDAATQIQVTATDGEVTLAGTVDGVEDRRRAGDIAEGVAGVTSVLNNLRVRQPGGTGATG
jgi:osmotically-inducible protein OsmY